MLRVCVNLESLQVSWDLPCSAWDWGEGTSACSITMPSLCVLEIIVDQPSVLEFLNSLHLPSLRSFHLEVIDRRLLWDRPIEGIETFLASLDSLEELTISSHTSFLSDFVPWLSRTRTTELLHLILPNLNHLSLHVHGDPLRLEADQQHCCFGVIVQEVLSLVNCRFHQSTIPRISSTQVRITHDEG